MARTLELAHFPVRNIQSTKSPVELNSILPKFFCYVTWLVVSPD